MAQVMSAISMSLDGYVTGPNDSREHPLGEGGERLHRWLDPRHHTPDDVAVLGEMVAGVGAIVMGRRSYDFCEGEGGWGEGGPAGDVPCFVVTHRPPPAHASDVFTFVHDGVPAAIERAKAVAGEQVVGLHGATTVQQALAAGLVEEVQVHLVPVLLGSGVRLFDDIGGKAIELETLRVITTPHATHLRYRVVHG
ncbi:dihydrofolate reductase family protein [Actinophytocola sp.]|uniref:dihydrofolate reductase family protein n=1 Tax=Actinophytocola sp. TaxID=1872138 RepID=UPI003D6BDC25